ncbi:GNAT family N-acetyltransferase [Microlunatus speluncae]|uniref:GNAT family N-acetyltransferase n=1 Tax=Microlunatus speluncae TaxID=2594267 RepID=UPI0012666C13|nr:GNAT family N-acetyltransferase [Microlunatus speluncae]
MAWFVEAWVEGWVRSRRPEAMQAIEDGWFIRTGSAKEACRWVLTRPTTERLAEILAGPVPATGCVKFAGEPREWMPRFGPGWDEDELGWFMALDLEPTAPAAVPDGYRLEVITEPELIMIRIVTADGDLAASGQCGLAGDHAVPDKIITEPDHQRRGLGRAVMRELQRQARAAGARTAVLSATEGGRALYRRLGWRELSGLVGAYYRPEV